MITPWFVYVILLVIIVIAGAVMFFASLDPEGRAGNAVRISSCLALVLCVVLAILAALDLVRWISTS